MLDRTLALLLFILLFPLLVFITILIRILDPGAALYWSKRVGKNNKLFSMPKFRSMKVGTPVVATHLLKDSSSHVFPFGSFLRKTSLDEIPQLISIIKGDMVFVGPRPALYNQDDLIELRAKNNIHTLTPGITGWAQINGRDEISIEQKVLFDKEYLDKKSIIFDLKILYLTFIKVILRKDVTH